MSKTIPDKTSTPWRSRSNRPSRFLRVALGLASLFSAGGALGQPLDSMSCPSLTGWDGFDNGPQGVTAATSKLNQQTPFVKVTLAGAQCNDGSDAVMYIRPADAHWGRASVRNPINPASDDWIIHFQGGGSCKDADDCFKRWCGGPQTGVFESAGKMSSLGLPVAIHAGRGAIGSSGIFNRNEANGFSAMNHVFLYYCSSDQWLGSAQHSSLTATDGESYHETFDLTFDGQGIVHAAIERLLQGARPDSNPYYTNALPSLRDADRVLFTASSAGTVGLRSSIDQLAEQMANVNPATEVRAVFDAAFSPALEEPNLDFTLSDPTADLPFPESYEQTNRTQVLTPALSFWGVNLASVADVSCMQTFSKHQGNGIPHPGACLDPTHLSRDHITTPSFLRMDLRDNVAIRQFQNSGIAPQPSFEAVVRAQLEGMATYPSADARPESPGVFGPNCTQHVALTDNAHFFREQITDANGDTISGGSFHRSLLKWLGGAATQLVQGPSTPSNCP